MMASRRWNASGSVRRHVGGALGALLLAAPALAQPGFVENWEAGVQANVWRLWGTPPVKIVDTNSASAGTNSLDVDGDSWCDSGLYSQQSFDVRRGFQLDWAQNTLAGAGNARAAWDQSVRVGLAAVNVPSDAPCSFQGEPKHLVSVEVIAHTAPTAPGEGQLLKIEGAAVEEVTFIADGAQYGPGLDATWFSYQIEVVQDLPEGRGTLTVSRTPTAGGTATTIATGRVNLSGFTNAAVAIQGRSNGRGADVDILVDDVALTGLKTNVQPGTLTVGRDIACGTEAVVPVSVTNVANTIDSFGFDFVYNPAMVSFKGARSGTATRSWLAVSGAPLMVTVPDPNNPPNGTMLVESGTARVGGFRGEAGSLITEGDIVELVFVCPPGVTACVGASPVAIVAPTIVDDLAGYAPVDGEAGFGSDLVRGDVNGDCRVTPEDAQLAFRCFIEFGCPPEANAARADVAPGGGDGNVTPIDAQTIFEIYLGLNPQ